MGIDDIISGVIGGILKPLVGAYEKHLDTNAEAFKTGTDADRANYAAWVDYQIKVQQLKVASNQWLGPKILYMIVGLAASIHTAAVFIDSTFLFHLGIAKLPGVYEAYEQMIVASLFVTSLAQGPINAVTQYFQRKNVTKADA